MGQLPQWITIVSGYSAVVSSVIITTSILLHLANYRKPFQQRLMIRIHLIIPLFALSCYCMLTIPQSIFVKYFVEPLREVYEAFVIYTFFSLLTEMLGGERHIIIFPTGREPVPHPGFMRYIFSDLDISDLYTFLNIKRGILQYVWLKPAICFGILFFEAVGLYDVNDLGITSIYLWLTLLYNASVSLSLYCLAVFWKILWNDLKPHKPVGKFLCVKLIIFASYWQGIILAILSVTGVLPQTANTDKDTNIGVAIQNALLCVEMIPFAIGHWFSFTYVAFTVAHIPNGRLKFRYAVRDMFGIRDLVNDFKLTFYGDYYKDYKLFDSVDASVAHPDSKSRMSRIQQGLRYHGDGRQKHWIQKPSVSSQSVDYSTLLKLPLLPSNPRYSPSFKSIGTSTRGIYPPSPKLIPSPPDSPSSSPIDINDLIMSISEAITGDGFSYTKEHLDEDELYYKGVRSVINNYKLDQKAVKKMLNYPIVDSMIRSHEYGYKVKKLREDRNRRQLSIKSGRSTNASYGSIV